MRANQPFILFIHHIWGERVLWGAVFIIQTAWPQTISSQFHNFSRLIPFIQCSGPSKHACAFSETVQKNSKITYQVCKEILTELRFNIIKNLLCLFFIDSFMTVTAMSNTRGTLSTPASDVYERLKTNNANTSRQTPRTICFELVRLRLYDVNCVKCRSCCCFSSYIFYFCKEASLI